MIPKEYMWVSIQFSTFFFLYTEKNHSLHFIFKWRVIGGYGDMLFDICLKPTMHNFRKIMPVGTVFLKCGSLVWAVGPTNKNPPSPCSNRPKSHSVITATDVSNCPKSRPHVLTQFLERNWAKFETPTPFFKKK